jgi:hypothetical protein
MHIRTVLVFAVCCLQAMAASATTFFIDSSESYLAIEAPSWQRGAEWWVMLPGGETSISGYEWQLITEAKRFSLSGTLEVSPAGTNWTEQQQLQIDSSHMVSHAPAEIGFELPRFVSIVNPTVAELQWNNACSGGSTGGFASCLVPFPFKSLTGTLSDGTLKILGQAQGFAIIGENVLGGIEAPPLPEYSLADFGYSYHIAALIPEPPGALMMIFGLAALSLRKLNH